MARVFTMLGIMLLSGCVRRVMHVESDPPGAIVFLNDRELGRTPFQKQFLWYGNYDVVARAEGYQTLITQREVTAPWWQWVPFDVLTDFLPVRDDETIRLHMVKETPTDPTALLVRGEQLRQQLEAGSRTTHRNVLDVKPVARPTTRPATDFVDEATTQP